MTYCKICREEVDEWPKAHWDEHNWLEVFGKPVEETEYDDS